MMVRELTPLDLIMEQFVSATARWAQRSSSSEGVAGMVDLGTGVLAVGVAGLSVISSSSASLWGGEGVEGRFSKKESSSISLGDVWVSGMGFGLGSGLLEDIELVGLQGRGEGVEGVVDAVSVIVSPSSARTLGGKNCDPVRESLGSCCLVPIGEGLALMLADLMLDISFMFTKQDRTFCLRGGGDYMHS